MHISELNIYPLKSGRRISLQHSELTTLGLTGDRIATLIDDSGKFITQRTLQELVTITATQNGNGLRIEIDGGESIQATATDERIDVTVWNDVISASLANPETNAALSHWLQQDVRLAFYDSKSKRTTDTTWTDGQSSVTFADGFQLLVTTTKSLEALNENMSLHDEGSVTMDRFRPNIVIENDIPWEEDGWASIEINGVIIDFVKPCARCIMTTQDQISGSREFASPMFAMGRIRMSDDRRVPGPLFGWNGVPRGQTELTVGDKVTVNARNQSLWPFKRRG